MAFNNVMSRKEDRAASEDAVQARMELKGNIEEAHSLQRFEAPFMNSGSGVHRMT